MKNENLKNITCEESELLIDEYLDGMINLNDKEVMDSHIESCIVCKEYFENNKALVKSLSSLSDENYFLSAEKKNNLWNKTEKKIDFRKHVSESELNKKSDSEKNIPPGFLSRYKYVLSGIAAVILIAAMVFIFKNTDTKNLQLSNQNLFGLPTYWKVTNLKGTPLIGDAVINSVDSIKEGQWIKTNDTSSAELMIASLGKVIIEPNSKIVFIKGEDGNNRIAVEYGTIHADMNSDKKHFFVEMPSAVATDSKGNYKLTIDSSGDGMIYVTSGNVEIKSNKRDAFIPAGNFVMTKKDFGPGTPFNENSSVIFKKALSNFDFGNCTDVCVNTLLKSAKATDAVTLVNLIPKVEDKYKDDLYKKAAGYIPPPPSVNQDSLNFFDEKELQQWVDKIQEEVSSKIEKNMKNLQKNLENMKEIEKLNLDTLQWLDNFQKNWKFDGDKIPKGKVYKYNWNNDTSYFDKEEFEKDMKELKEDLKDMNEDLKENLDFNKEEFKKEMMKVQEEIKKSIEEIKKDTSIHNQIKKEIEKNLQENLKYNKESEIKELPEAPETPDTDETPEKPEDKEK